MTSGYMWVRIRNAPYQVFNPTGSTYYVPGMQNMVGIEAQIVGSLNFLSAFCMIALSLVAPKLKSTLVRRLTIYACLSIFILSFSAEIALMRRKVPAYPFRLIFA